ncbi:MAG: ATP/GTP-binding protein [Candidatus Sericytochromatia bacterium]
MSHNKELGMHYQALDIKHFRGFKDIRFKNFNRINIITGLNNIGKTALLEALFIHAGATDYRLPLLMNNIRSMTQLPSEAEEIWGWFFYNKDFNQPIELIAKLQNGHQSKLQMALKPIERPWEFVPDSEVPKTGNFTATSPEQVMGIELIIEDDHYELDRKRALIAPNGHIYGESKKTQLKTPDILMMTDKSGGISPDDIKRFGKITVQNRLAEIIEPLKIIEPRLKNLTVVVMGQEQIFADIGLSTLIPLALFGMGTNRLLTMILNIMSKPGGVVLIDEFGMGLHHSVLVKVWEAIFKAAQIAKVQLFLTTHSKECIDALIANKNLDVSQISGYGLVHSEDTIQANYFSGTELKELHDLINFDLRGAGEP